MANYMIRKMTEADFPQAAVLWQLVFGDDAVLVMEFLRLFSDQPYFAACAELDGKLAAAAYCPQGTDLIATDGTASKGAYLYAVATHPDHRKQGLAKEICLLLRNAAFDHGAAYVFTKPSEESLYPWYQEKIGAVPMMGGQTVTYQRTQGGSIPVEELTAAEYAQQRQTVLKGIPHVRHSSAWLEWESQLHKAYGGGFYRIGSHIATLYQDGDSLQIGEFLPAPTDEAIQSLLRATNAAKCTCTIHGTDHYVSVVSADGMLPKENAWFGPCYG